MVRPFQHIVVVGSNISEPEFHSLMSGMLYGHISPYQPTSFWLLAGDGKKPAPRVLAMKRWLEDRRVNRYARITIVDVGASLVDQAGVLCLLPERYDTFAFFCDGRSANAVSLVANALLPNVMVYPVITNDRPRTLVERLVERSRALKHLLAVQRFYAMNPRIFPAPAR